MAPHLLKELVLAYGVGVLVVVLLHRLRVPTVVGFLLAGVLLGPHGLGLVTDTYAVESLAEIGVVILLFTIGVEMSLSRVLRLGMALLAAGLLQMGLAAAGVALPVAMFGGSAARAVTLGLLVAASSTTLLLRIVSERGELEAPHGRLALAIALVQDLCVVPIMVILPMLSGAGGGGASVLLPLGKAGLVILGTFLAGRYVVPRIFEVVVSTRSRELFALTVVFLCLATAWLAGLAGLSLALGAFLGGLVVSESPYSQQVLGEMLPIRDGLAGLFFIGVGMLLDVGHAAAHAGELALAVTGIFLVKLLTTGVAVTVTGYGLRTAVLAGFALAQVGEFSFVLAREARTLGILGEADEQLFLAAAVLTMAAAPFLYRLAPGIADRLDRRFLGLRARRRLADVENDASTVRDHVILVGFGLTGQNVAKALSHHGRAFVAVEMNPGTVRKERASGVPILFGDAGHPEVLEKAGIAGARMLVVGINDVPGTRRVVELARRLRPDLPLIVRTRYVREAAELFALGANEVIPDELETSVEIFARVLHAYGLPSAAIEHSTRAIRSEAQPALRPTAARAGTTAAQASALAHLDLEDHVVGPGAPADGRTIGELGVRSRYGVTVASVRRSGSVLPDPSASTRLQAADVVVLLGSPGPLAAAADLFRPPAPSRAVGGGVDDPRPETHPESP